MCIDIQIYIYIYTVHPRVDLIMRHNGHSFPQQLDPAAPPPPWPLGAAAPGSYATGARFRCAAPLGTPLRHAKWMVFVRENPNMDDLRGYPHMRFNHFENRI